MHLELEREPRCTRTRQLLAADTGATRDPMRSLSSGRPFFPLLAYQCLRRGILFDDNGAPQTLQSI